jgi:hypothetical protein
MLTLRVSRCLLWLLACGILLGHQAMGFASRIHHYRPSIKLGLSSSPLVVNGVVESQPRLEKDSTRISILVCPAQFCVPDDYQVLFQNLQSTAECNVQVGTTVVAPLPRTEWIKVAKQLPTKNFWDATLPVHETLGWYFDAMEAGLSEIFAKEGPDANVCIIGHSIGGWVARAYLGGLSRYVIHFLAGILLIRWLFEYYLTFLF